MVKFIKFIGFAILAVGIISFLFLGFGMKTYEPGLTEGFTYEELHPLRWVYAFAPLLSSSFFGSVLLGISRLVERKDEEINYIKDIHTDMRLMKARNGIVD